MTGSSPTSSCRARRAAALGCERGFTLTEILVAAIVLAVGVLATATVFASSDSNTLDAELQQIASEQAEIAIEDLRSLAWDEVGHASSPLEPPGEDRLSVNDYEASTGSDEELVIAANDEGGDSTGGVLQAADQARAFTVDSDPADPESVKITGTVYTFVTWRDEDCQVLDVAPFAARLQTLVDRLQATSARLTTLRNNVIGVFGSIPLIPASVRSIYETLIPGAVSDLDGAGTTLGNLIDDVQAGSVDVCDISAGVIDAIEGLVDPDGAGGLSASAQILGVSANLDAAADGVNVPLAGGLVCAALGTFCDDSEALQTEINSGGLSATVTGIDADAGTITGGFDASTTHNTKRVTVAVAVDAARGDITPRNVVYIESVLIDPEDGLL